MNLGGVNMSSLNWASIVEAFFTFRAKADAIGFYTKDLDQMEQSLLAMRPVDGLEFKDVLSTREEYNHVTPCI